jgi:hypothetical protein
MKPILATAILMSLTAMFGSPAVAQEEQGDDTMQGAYSAELSEAEKNFAAGIMYAAGDGVPEDDAFGLLPEKWSII